MCQGAVIAAAVIAANHMVRNRLLLWGCASAFSRVYNRDVHDNAVLHLVKSRASLSIASSTHRMAMPSSLQTVP